MKTWIIYTCLVCILALSVFCTVKLIQLDGETDAFLYQKALGINPSCANYCAELDYFEDGSTKGRECLKRVIERGHCRK